MTNEAAVCVSRCIWSLRRQVQKAQKEGVKAGNVDSGPMYQADRLAVHIEQHVLGRELSTPCEKFDWRE